MINQHIVYCILNHSATSCATEMQSWGLCGELLFPIESGRMPGGGVVILVLALQGSH